VWDSWVPTKVSSSNEASTKTEEKRSGLNEAGELETKLGREIEIGYKKEPRQKECQQG
jgi:hypothetical protein